MSKFDFLCCTNFKLLSSVDNWNPRMVRIVFGRLYSSISHLNYYYYYYYYCHHHHHHNIIIIVISFMRGIYTYIPETNHVSREFMVSISLVPALVLLYFYVSTFRRMCAVPNTAVFCSSFTSCASFVQRYILNQS